MQRRVHPGERGRAFGLVDAPDAESLLDAGVGREAQRHPTALAVDVVVHSRAQGAHERVDPARIGLLGLGRAGDDEGDACLVHEQEVRLVDDGAGGIALQALRFLRDEAVAQVVESRFTRGEVGDVGPVRRPAIGGFRTLADRRDAQPEGRVDRSHPRRVASREVVVRGHHVHAPARQGVEAGGEHRREGLALAGLHLGDPSPVQGRARRRAARRTAAGRAGVGQPRQPARTRARSPRTAPRPARRGRGSARPVPTAPRRSALTGPRP